MWVTTKNMTFYMPHIVFINVIVVIKCFMVTIR